MINFRTVMLSLLITGFTGSLVVGMDFFPMENTDLDASLDAISDLNVNEYRGFSEAVTRLQGENRLGRALSQGTVVAVFLSKGLNSRSVDESGFSLLREAVKRGHLNEVAVLLYAVPLSKRFDLIIDGFLFGDTVLHVAARLGYVEIVKLLLHAVKFSHRRGLLLAVDTNDFTALHEAALNELHGAEMARMFLVYYRKHKIAIPQNLLPRLKELGLLE